MVYARPWRLTCYIPIICHVTQSHCSCAGSWALLCEFVSTLADRPMSHDPCIFNFNIYFICHTTQRDEFMCRFVQVRAGSWVLLPMGLCHIACDMARQDSFTCDMTHLHVTWVIYDSLKSSSRDMAYARVHQDSVWMCNVTYVFTQALECQMVSLIHTWHESFMILSSLGHVTWLIHVCGMTLCVAWLCMNVSYNIGIHAPSELLIYTSHESFMIHSSLRHMIWLIHVCDMTLHECVIYHRHSCKPFWMPCIYKCMCACVSVRVFVRRCITVRGGGLF